MGRFDTSKYTISDEARVRLAQWPCHDEGGLTKDEGEARLAANLAVIEGLQGRFSATRSRALLIVLQGIDTAGKDGVIRKVMTGMNPQGVFVWSFKQPTEVELSHDYLWRLHARCPGKGEVAIFNRSHYEDIIVGRVHGWLSDKHAERRQRHIREFERLLCEEGTIVLKFFLSISKDEQLERLRERVAEPSKQWKFSAGDLAERELWPRYIDTYEEMLSTTSTKWAPWVVVPSNRNWFRNLLVSEVVRDTLDGLKLEWPKPKEDLTKLELR